MALKRAILHLAGRVALSLLAIALAAVVLLHAEKILLRYRAERLLADIQSIELHRSDWSKAQALMYRWGRWGRYEGSCTAEQCRYQITLDNWIDSEFYRHRNGHGFWQLMQSLVGSPTYRWVARPDGVFFAGFIVEEGTIRRTFMEIMMEQPPSLFSPDDDPGYLVSVVAQSRDSLNREAHEDWRLYGSNEQLAEHPYYKVGQPGACEGCMDASVTYAVQTPSDQIRQVTSFDLSCLTKLRPCTRVEDLLPLLAPWRLYTNQYMDQKIDLVHTPKPCDIPVWALGRDALAVVSVDAVSMDQEQESADGNSREIDSVRLDETLKGSIPWKPGTMLRIYPSQVEHMIPHKRYLVMLSYSIPHSDAYTRPAELKRGPRVELDRCGVLGDTPANRAELQRGFTQNDPLRMPEFWNEFP